MDAHRFDGLTRALTRATTRRQISRGLAGLALGVALWSVVAPEADARKKKKKCGPCQVRKRGKCKGRKPDETICKGDGLCFAGACIPRPTCLGFGGDCSGGDAACCGICAGGLICVPGGPDTSCHADADCNTVQGLTCIAYRCRPPAPPM